jgi:hypothetical protein
MGRLDQCALVDVDPCWIATKPAQELKFGSTVNGCAESFDPLDALCPSRSLMFMSIVFNNKRQLEAMLTRARQTLSCIP